MNDSRKRSQRQETIRDREARLSAILETCVEGIITINERGIIASMNPAAETLFGYSETEAVGQNVSILMPSPYQQKHDAYLNNYLESGEKKIIGIGREVVGKRKNGSTFPMHLSVSEVLISSGRIFTGFVHDLTERDRLRDRIIQNERLSAIGEAMAGLAHESRNALQRSQACLDILEVKMGRDPKVLDLIQGIQRAQEELHRLYEGVRNYAAPVNLDRESCDVAELVRGAWQDTAVSREGRAVLLQEVPPSIDTCCEVDSPSIKQVFRNLFENAIQASSGSVEIQVRYDLVRRDNGGELSISFRDNGPGLPPDEASRIFDSFYTTKTVGTGLGLSVAKRIVLSHGGEIFLNSEYKGGAEFIVLLPQES